MRGDKTKEVRVIFFRVNLFRRILNADVLRDVSVKQTKRADVNFDLSPQVYRNSEDFPQDHRNIEISPQAHSKLLELLNLLPCK